MQRHDVASTLMRRCIDVMCLLGILSPCVHLGNDLLYWEIWSWALGSYSSFYLFLFFFPYFEY